jgi:hypothetical protein
MEAVTRLRVKWHARGMSFTKPDPAKKKAAIEIAALRALFHQRRFQPT